MRLRCDPGEIGWRIGMAHEPRGGDLWVPWDRTAGVIGPQGSGKTLDLLTPALLGAPGAALVTLTKVEDLLLSLTQRSSGERPCVVLDPFGVAEGVGAEGVGELVWDPIEGCVDPKVAERRAKAFTAGTVKGAIHGGTGDDAARFYAAESSKVISAFFHAAALTGKTLDEVLRWVANPLAATDPGEILRRHPHAEPFWHGLLSGALSGDDRTAGNTVTTVQQAMSLFFQADIRRRCVPGPGRSGTDLVEVIRRRGTIYLLGREDPYASASPLMTAVAEHVLDTGLLLANGSPWGGRLCPPLLSVLDELPSTAPLPTLRTRMANERAQGLSFIWAAQTRAQLTSIFGEHEARALLGLTNVLVMFGGSKDVQFNQEISDLLGTVRIARRSYQSGAMAGRTTSGEDIAILRPEEVRQLPERRALVVAENGKPLIAQLFRCVEGRSGQRLLADQRRLRERLTSHRSREVPAKARAIAALVEAQRLGLVDQHPHDAGTGVGADAGQGVDPVTLTPTQAVARPMILPFPVPGRQVQLAYRELNLAVNGTEEQKKQIGNPALLPRPWEPGSCLESELRLQVWRWLEDVVAWLNHEYSWDIGGAIPTCWPMHPHLIHDLAVVADQRRRAGLAMTSDALEEWHRYCLPAFVDRIRSRLKAHCDDEHSPWPGRSRHAQHLSVTGIHGREQAYTGDVEALCTRTRTLPTTRPAPRLGLVDLETGEIRDLNQNLGEVSDPGDRDH